MNIQIIGGGLSGLALSIMSARAGHQVTVYEKRAYFGGHAHSTDERGFRGNFGPRAIYRAGELNAFLGREKIALAGRVPKPRRAVYLDEDELYDLPLTPFGIARAPFLKARSRLRTMAILARPPIVDGVSAASRLEGLPGDARRFVEALLHLTTYAPDLDALPARPGFLNLKRATKGVIYLDDVELPRQTGQLHALFSLMNIRGDFILRPLWGATSL